MTNIQSSIYAQLKSAIEFELEAFGNRAETLFADDVNIKSVLACFKAIAAEKGLQSAEIDWSHSGRATIDVVMSWVEAE